MVSLHAASPAVAACRRLRRSSRSPLFSPHWCPWSSCVLIASAQRLIFTISRIAARTSLSMSRLHTSTGGRNRIVDRQDHIQVAFQLKFRAFVVRNASLAFVTFVVCSHSSFAIRPWRTTCLHADHFVGQEPDFVSSQDCAMGCRHLEQLWAFALDVRFISSQSTVAAPADLHRPTLLASPASSTRLWLRDHQSSPAEVPPRCAGKTSHATKCPNHNRPSTCRLLRRSEPLFPV